MSRSGSNRLDIDEFNRWGGRLDEEIVRLLAQHLSDALQTKRVFRYPSQLASDSRYRVAVEIHAFDGVRGGTVTLAAAWSLIDERNGRVLKTEQAAYRAESPADDVDAYILAMTDLLGRLGNDMARRLAELPHAGP